MMYRLVATNSSPQIVPGPTGPQVARQAALPVVDPAESGLTVRWNALA